MRREVNRADEMAVFVKVVDLGGFAAAARVRGLAPSAVSRIVSRLERRLGVALLRRSTRRIALTPEGERFYRRSQAVLADLDAAEREASGGALPIGRVRISSSASYIAHVLGPLLPDLLHRHPGLSIDIVQSDALSNLIAEDIDIAVRAGPMPDSSLVARSLGATRLILVATPWWAEQYGREGAIAPNGLISFTYARAADTWLPVTGDESARVRINDGEGMRQLVLSSVAAARLDEFTVRDDLAAGRLVRLDDDRHPEALDSFHAVFVGKSGVLPARVQVILDYLSCKGRVC